MVLEGRCWEMKTEMGDGETGRRERERLGDGGLGDKETGRLSGRR